MGLKCEGRRIRAVDVSAVRAWSAETSVGLDAQQAPNSPAGIRVACLGRPAGFLSQGQEGRQSQAGGSPHDSGQCLIGYSGHILSNSNEQAP